MAAEWRNWAGDQVCARRRSRPASREELAAARRARDGGGADGPRRRLGPLVHRGGAHRRHDDRGRGAEPRPRRRPRLRAGQGRGRDHARRPQRRARALGLAMENLGDIDRQTLAGAISTATHGTGAEFRNLSAQVEALELVLADGERARGLRATPTPTRCGRRGWGSVRSGSIYSVTLRPCPASPCDRVDAPGPLEETLGRLDELADAQRPLRVLRLPPHRHGADHRAQPHRRPAAAARARERLPATRSWSRTTRWTRSRGRPPLPAAIPRCSRLAARPVSRGRRTDRSYRIFASERRVRFTEMEYAIPREHGPGGGAAGARVGPRAELRSASRSSSGSSPATTRCSAPPTSARPPTSPSTSTGGWHWEPYFRAVEAIMDDYEGRPHWGKRHFQTAETLAPRYPRWDDFPEVRARLDPDAPLRERLHRPRARPGRS